MRLIGGLLLGAAAIAVSSCNVGHPERYDLDCRWIDSDTGTQTIKSVSKRYSVDVKANLYCDHDEQCEQPKELTADENALTFDGDPLVSVDRRTGKVFAMRNSALIGAPSNASELISGKCEKKGYSGWKAAKF